MDPPPEKGNAIARSSSSTFVPRGLEKTSFKGVSIPSLVLSENSIQFVEDGHSLTAEGNSGRFGDIDIEKYFRTKNRLPTIDELVQVWKDKRKEDSRREMSSLYGTPLRRANPGHFTHMPKVKSSILESGAPDGPRDKDSIVIDLNNLSSVTNCSRRLVAETLGKISRPVSPHLIKVNPHIALQGYLPRHNTPEIQDQGSLECFNLQNIEGNLPRLTLIEEEPFEEPPEDEEILEPGVSFAGNLKKIRECRMTLPEEPRSNFHHNFFAKEIQSHRTFQRMMGLEGLPLLMRKKRPQPRINPRDDFERHFASRNPTPQNDKIQLKDWADNNNNNVDSLTFALSEELREKMRVWNDSEQSGIKGNGREVVPALHRQRGSKKAVEPVPEINQKTRRGTSKIINQNGNDNPNTLTRRSPRKRVRVGPEEKISPLKSILKNFKPESGIGVQKRTFSGTGSANSKNRRSPLVTWQPPNSNSSEVHTPKTPSNAPRVEMRTTRHKMPKSNKD